MEFILVNLLMVYDLESVFLNGTMGNFLRATGKKELKVVMAYGDPLKETLTRESGKITDNMEMALSSIEIAHIKDNLKIF